MHFPGFVFPWWKRLEAGSIHRQTRQLYVTGLKPVIRSLLAEGRPAPAPETAKVCRELLPTEATHRAFATTEGVPPHNNATERALCHGVIWRKTSHGTDGKHGCRFVERLLTVDATCRRRGHDVLGLLTYCLRARLDGTPAPSLPT